MESVQTRALNLVNSSVRTWSSVELSEQLCCSYSTARTALVKLFYAGKVQRIKKLNPRSPGTEWMYFKRVV